MFPADKNLKQKVIADDCDWTEKQCRVDVITLVGLFPLTHNVQDFILALKMDQE